MRKLSISVSFHFAIFPSLLLFNCLCMFLVYNLLCKRLVRKAPGFLNTKWYITGISKAQVIPNYHTAPWHQNKALETSFIIVLTELFVRWLTAEQLNTDFLFRAVKHLLTGVLSAKSGIYQTYLCHVFSLPKRKQRCLQRVNSPLHHLKQERCNRWAENSRL